MSTPVAWLINDQSPASLGLSELRLSYANLAPDTLTFTHQGAAWDADALFTFGTTITLKRDGVKVFVGKVRRTPRFLGAQAESLTYEVAGPWDWLQRRILLQNQAVVVDPETSTVPTLVPQGLIILGQSDAGTSVELAEALEAVFEGVGDLDLAVGADFDYPVVWDEVADLTRADAIVRLLATAPDAVAWWDYTATPPTLHLARRANLTAATIAVAPAGLGGTAAYAPLESITVIERPDLVPTGVFLTYRRIDTVNGSPYLVLSTETAGSGAATDEGALARTIELAGLNSSSTVLEQECRTRPLSSSLTASGTITSGADFTALSAFWKSKVGYLNDPTITVQGFRGTGRAVTDTGEDPAPSLNTGLANELVEGGITPWMEDTPLNIVGQDQTYTAEVALHKAGVFWKNVTVSAGVMATTATTKTYRYTESTTTTPAEPTPVGMASQLYDALSVLPVQGSLTLIEEECTLTTRVGKVVNLTGGRSAWSSMRALVQGVQADLDTGRTQITYGPPEQLGPQDLVAILRANRFKNAATRGLLRATGVPA